MLDALYTAVRESLHLWLAMSPYLLLGMFMAGVIHVFLGREFITRHLGGSPMRSVMKAAVLGTPLPVCSCGVIPIAAALHRDGASRSSVLSFLVSTPTTGVDSILATYSLMGPLFAIFRPIAALLSGFGVGAFNHFFDRKEESHKTTSHVDHAIPHHIKIQEVFRYGFLELAADIGKWLLIGVVVGGILTAAIPGDLLMKYFSNPGLHFLVILAVAVPLYVCATGSIPIAAALIQKGFSPGAALVFLVAGPATNTITLSFVYSKLGRRSFYIYLAFIIGISLLLGWVFNVVWAGLGGGVELIAPTGELIPYSVRIVSGIVLFSLVINGFRRGRGPKCLTHTLHVSDMTCKHCKMTIENGLKQLPGVTEVSVDLSKKAVGIDGDVRLEDVRKAITEMGFTPEEKEES